MDLIVVFDAPSGSVFDLARRITPERYIRVAGYWWWGASTTELDLERALGSAQVTKQKEKTASPCHDADSSIRPDKILLAPHTAEIIGTRNQKPARNQNLPETPDC
jgi:hypothetical protein